LHGQSQSFKTALLLQGKQYFVKVAMGGRDDSMFQGEAQGLQAMYGEPAPATTHRPASLFI